MVVYSGNRFDQNGCTARIAYHELGIARERQSLTHETIVNDIESVTAENSGYLNRLERMQDIFFGYRERKVLEQLISAQLDKVI